MSRISTVTGFSVHLSKRLDSVRRPTSFKTAGTYRYRKDGLTACGRLYVAGYSRAARHLRANGVRESRRGAPIAKVGVARPDSAQDYPL